VLTINARGKIALLNHFAREGLPLGRRNPTVTLGRRSDGALLGVGLRWPEGLPGSGARLTELVVIATRGKTDLSGLETRELALGRNGGNALQRMLGRLCDGVYRDLHGSTALDAFFVDLHDGRLGARIVMTHDFDEAPFTRGLRLGYDDTEKRAVLRAGPAQSNR